MQLSLNDYWYIIQKRKRLALTFFLVAVISTAFYSFLHPKIYQATTTVLIERASKNILSFDNIFPVQTAGLDYYPTQYKVLKSRSIAKRVMDYLNLWPQFAWASDPVSAFLRQVQVDPVKQSRLVELSAFSERPEQARDMANAVVKFYIEENLNGKLAMTQQAAGWIQGKIGDVKDRLSRSELEFEVVKLRKELAELNEKYLPKHPKVLRTKSRLKAFEGGLSPEMMKELSEGNLSVLYAELDREVESNRKIYDSMLGRLKETLASQGMEDTNVIVVDPAEAPKKPVAPRILLNLILSVFVGSFGGVGLCLVFESLDNTLKSAEDIERTTDLPVLGVIGKWSASKKELITHHDRHSSEAEFFRAVRTSLMFSSPDKPFRTLLVTSPFPGEGKTTTASNLAVVLAQSGARVLLLDTDMRKPRVHKVFGQPNSQGLSHALTGSQDVSDFIFKTPVENLSALFCGPIPPTPSELLGSQKMKGLIHRLREDFDYLICDSSPFMAITDAVVLSSVVDGVLIVTRYGKTPKDVLARGKQKFADVQARIAGVVINAVDLKQERYRYPYGAYSYYQAVDSGQTDFPKKIWKGAKPEPAAPSRSVARGAANPSS